MAELLKVAKAMFQNRSNWNSISNIDKEECFFIFNRYFSKKYPEKSQLLNDKLQDKVAAMNLWFHFMESEPYPKWFWSKSEKEKDKSKYTNEEIIELMFNLQIERDELDLLIKWYPELIEEEIEYLKKSKQQDKKRK